MEIIIAMVLTIIRVIWYILQAILILGLIGAVIAAIGVAGIYYKRWDDKRNDEASNRGDFEESRTPDAANKKLYVQGVIPADESEAYWREIDRLNDAKILENTKDL